MGIFGKSARSRLMFGAAVGVLAISSGPAWAEVKAPINIAPQSLASALYEFGGQTGRQVMFTPDVTASKTTGGVVAGMDEQAALAQLLQGTGLTFRREANVFVIVQAGEGGSGPQSAGAGGDVDALIVTAQKREENIQDVPIAISAFSQEALEKSQIAGGPDLITQVPNMTFTKTNFSSYSIQIRGIGTQAVSATTDAAVAVAMNNTPFIRNRFFEQEFYDQERVEVLRGPQGTLYGRNATAGAVNIITAKPKFTYSAKAAVDVANYNSTRVEGMVNIPLAEDMVALRLAGAWTKRAGFVTNEITGAQIDGRDLWSTRVSLRFAPTDAIDANLIWEHFQEDDDRLRSGKQVCKRDDRTQIAGIPRPKKNGYAALFSQGCLPASMYAPESYQAPDGFSLPYYHPLGQLFLPVVFEFDPYRSTTQSRDLRVIESTVDPQYRTRSDVAELQVSIDLTDTLTLTSETAYSTDTLFSMQDFNRFNTASGAFANLNSGVTRQGILTPGPNGNVFCDPQIGCADRLVAVDLSTAKSRQFSQEFRVSSDFDGPLNFSLGGNFLRYDTEDKYYVFINTLTLYSTIGNLNAKWPNDGAIPAWVPGVSDNMGCLIRGPLVPDLNRIQPVTGCVYIDPNPINNLNDQGHNYFLSRNPYKLISYAAFGELYYNITPDLKLTGGLRVTVDKKDAPRIPSWLLAAGSVGFPIAEVIEQEWTEPTGRLALDWKPHLSFTDDTLLYASYAHGYKAGGANPPGTGIVTYATQLEPNGAVGNGLIAQSATHPKTFAPEFVDAFEIGSKNTLFDGRLTLNAAAFYYDYKGYQISYIVDRSAVNLNFDADIWGLELEADWRPTDNLKIGIKGGYENTRVADGSQAIDLMDRTAGNPDWLVVRPFPSFPSNCILPVYTARGTGAQLTPAPTVYQNGQPGPCEIAYVLGLDPVTRLTYVPNPTVNSSNFNFPFYFPNYIGFNPLVDYGNNHGEGFYKQLGGNELPNAPKYTGTLTADYTLPLRGDWLITLHGDLHYQGESWARIFNTPGYDKLKAYSNLNLAAVFNNEDAGWRIMAYVKNVMDADSITGAFLNSDDTGLTTNVFLTEPRLYGIRVTKDWTGGAFLFGDGAHHQPGQPYRFTVELGAGVSRFSSDNETLAPAFVNAYQAPLRFPIEGQDRDLDWGDQREVKLTYAAGDGWRASGAYRYGRTNGSTRDTAYERLPDRLRTDTFVPSRVYEGPSNYAISKARDGEEFTMADFMVSRDVGIGLLGDGGQSSVGFGLRYAHFASTSSVNLLGAPDWYWPLLEPFKYPTDTHHAYRSTADSDRRFEGIGPILSWEASRRLFDDDAVGHVDLDWTVTGGVLFGKQATDVEGANVGRFYHFPPAIQFPRAIIDTVYNTPLESHRSENVTVPTLGLSLGLSYAVGGVKVGTGYRWERYFDAIDGGLATSKQYDRTIDGPYLKVSVGFGG